MSYHAQSAQLEKVKVSDIATLHPEIKKLWTKLGLLPHFELYPRFVTRESVQLLFEYSPPQFIRVGQGKVAKERKLQCVGGIRAFLTANTFLKQDEEVRVMVLDGLKLNVRRVVRLAAFELLVLPLSFGLGKGERLRMLENWKRFSRYDDEVCEDLMLKNIADLSDALGVSQKQLRRDLKKLPNV